MRRLTEGRWLREPDLSAWVAGSRLNLLRNLPQHTAEPAAQSAVERFLTHVQAAIERLGNLSDRSLSLRTAEGAKARRSCRHPNAIVAVQDAGRP